MVDKKKGGSKTNSRKIEPLSSKPISDKDAESVKGGATTEGVKKTMQTQV